MRSLLVALGVLLVLGASVALISTKSGAASAPLWTEGKPSLSSASASSPWVAVAKADTPAVVNISTTQMVKNPLAPGIQGGPFEDFSQQFFGNMPRTFRIHSLGSGFIIRSDGYIVTNNHVVDNASEIVVKLADGRKFPAKVVGRDAKTDIALVKIEATGLPVIPLGDSQKLQVGEPVMAIGNPFGLQGTATTGIVSAEGRVIGQGPYDQFIQTDASINPGNSGGPLVNQSGQVVGINTAIFSQSGGSVGIGFAVPINEAKTVLPQLEATGHVTRGWLGVSIQAISGDLAKAMRLQNTEGALVAQVMPDSPASKAGLQAGDVIMEYEGHPIAKASDLPRLVAATPVGKTATVQVLRDGKPLKLSLQVAAMPEPHELAAMANPWQPSLGLSVQPLTPGLAKQLGVSATSGVAVTGVQAGSPAAEAGLQPGDVIVDVNRQPVQTVADLRKALDSQKKGEAMLLRIRRKDASLFVALKPHPAQG
jgi:serine protease Do